MAWHSGRPVAGVCDDKWLGGAGNRQVVVVDYSTAWCGPCRMMEPVLVAWARELGPRVVFIKVDAEAQGNCQLAGSAGIRRDSVHVVGAQSCCDN